ncbi:MAG: hypothetical protein IKM41_02225, partial [Tidjanibacter sp.]|nr:hypothetical protein [Tidjanibacter sp.]
TLSTLSTLPKLPKLPAAPAAPKVTIAAEPLIVISTTPPDLLLGEVAERKCDHPSHPPLS